MVSRYFCTVSSERYGYKPVYLKFIILRAYRSGKAWYPHIYVVVGISRALPPLPTVFAGRDEACDPRASFSQWQSFLSDQPAEPLSFRKTQASLSQDAVTIARQWDVDSVWFRARSLSAIRAPNQFRLSFFSPHTSNISTAQVIQPHGLDLAHTRHTIIGTYQPFSYDFAY
ncbi:hypothetical protein BFJ71_g17214 [Fusarium oxysporum]|nr:hypothetical protein BFJ71_g17214 [Fusarium oxysporum]